MGWGPGFSGPLPGRMGWVSAKGQAMQHVHYKQTCLHERVILWMLVCRWIHMRTPALSSIMHVHVWCKCACARTQCKRFIWCLNLTWPWIFNHNHNHNHRAGGGVRGHITDHLVISLQNRYSKGKYLHHCAFPLRFLIFPIQIKAKASHQHTHTHTHTHTHGHQDSLAYALGYASTMQVVDRPKEDQKKNQQQKTAFSMCVEQN